MGDGDSPFHNLAAGQELGAERAGQQPAFNRRGHPTAVHVGDEVRDRALRDFAAGIPQDRFIVPGKPYPLEVPAVRGLVKEKRIGGIDRALGEAETKSAGRRFQLEVLDARLAVATDEQADTQRGSGRADRAGQRVRDAFERAVAVEIPGRLAKPLQVPVEEKEPFVRSPPERLEQLEGVDQVVSGRAASTMRRLSSSIACWSCVRRRSWVVTANCCSSSVRASLSDSIARNRAGSFTVRTCFWARSSAS